MTTKKDALILKMSLGSIRKLLEVRKKWYKSESEKLKIDWLKQKWKKKLK